jgi:exodeoxyribonuclease V gamma subunit
MPRLVIHRSERADPLVAALGELLASPPPDLFAVDIVAVPSRGVERWLAQRLSHVLGAVDGDGVCANVAFPSSTRMLDDAIAAADPTYAESVERWSPERSVWPVMALLEDIETRPWAAALSAHLAGDPGRRYAVAAKLARHLDAYGRSRPAMLRAWASGRDEQGDGAPLSNDLRWQAQLFRQLRDELGLAPAELHEAACARLGETPAAVDLPERVSIFGVTRISPSRIAVLEALAAHRDLHLWLNHPSPALWDAVAAGQPGPGRRADDRGALLVRNPLLTSLSRDIRELQQLLPDADTVHHPVPPRPNTLLGRLQDELAHDSVPAQRVELDPADRSLAVHACHGRSRQVEVVREAVLGLLRDDPTLEPRDIVVMCPDVEAFAPLVAAAFGMLAEPGAHPATQLRVKVADRSLRQTNPIVGLLTQVLELAASRVTASAILDLAGIAPVRRKFRFTDDDLERLRDWVTSTNARWGLDADHRARYRLGHVAQGTWRTSIDRLLLGVAMEEDGRWLGSALPLDDVDSGAIDLVGRVAELLDRVDVAARAMEQQHTVGEWAALLARTVFDLGEPEHAWQGAQLRWELNDIAESSGTVQLGRADVAVLLKHRLEGRPTRASFRTGTLTVCTLVPMRSVPHRVICLLGMDDGAFPRHGVIDGDDALARDPRTGERDVRSEDRQLFLDAICAAQEHLVITYTGADPRSGVPVPPCVPLGELLDAVDATAHAAGDRPAHEQIVIHHPLQPFDPRNFQPGRLGGTQPFSFDPSGLAGARASTQPRQAVAPLLSAPLPEPDNAPVELDDLVEFVLDPMKHFLKRRLQIATWQDDTEPADALPLDMRGLPEWTVGEAQLTARLAGIELDATREIALRRGDLPPGRLGERLLGSVAGNVEALLHACENERRVAAHTVDIDLDLDGTLLAGTVAGVHGTALLAVSYSNIGPRARLRAWVRYLALVAQLDDRDLIATTVGKANGGAARAVIAGLDPDDARARLSDLLALRRAGQCSPLPISLKTSEKYAERIAAGRNESAALYAAAPKWRSYDWGGENLEIAHELILGPDTQLSALTDFDIAGDDTLRFAPLALRLWRPLLAAETT